ncbi:MAG: PQQ-like beta-propeller repeat protein [Bryobacterales bacterium]|nr:PQQ-like beta-propeller repeat protein [Bryobacterales bacterium]
MSWLQSRTGTLLSSFLLPPLGIVLVWMRPGGVIRKLAISLLLCALTFGYLLASGLMRYELAGSGAGVFFSFGTKEQQIEKLEASRVQQASAPPEAPAAAEATPATAQAAEAAKPDAAVVPAAYWTDFRGPGRNGIAAEQTIRTQWPLKLLWKQPIGGGYASFVFGEGRAYTIEQRRDKEFVTAYDMKTGKEVWSHSYPAFFQESMGGDGPRATPTYHDGRVYSMGATGEMRVLDAKTGKVVWAKNILTEHGASNLTWGMCASPLIVDNMVIVQPGGSNGNSVVAYDKASGSKVWGALDDQQAYTSPMLVTLDGKRQILTVTAKRAVGLDPATGKLLWEYPWVTQYDVNASQPVLAGSNQVLLTAGYGHGSGLITIRGGTASKVWENNRMKNRFNSGVQFEGHVYGLDESIFSCIRISDGEQMWKAGRYGYGQVILAGGHLIVITEQGELVLVKPSPKELIEVAKFEAISGKTWNVPAIEGGVLLVRNATEMAAFRLSD